MDLTNNIEWKDGVSGGTPLMAENLNRVNKGTKTALEELESETQANIAAVQDSVTALKNGLENGSVVVNKSNNDGEGNNIVGTYAKQNGSYDDLTAGKAKKDGKGNDIESTYAKKNGTYEGMTAGKALYASEDKTKGTIEERLTNLGFKEGNITDSSSNVVIKLKRQGNYVLAEFVKKIKVSAFNGLAIPNNFIPKKDTGLLDLDNGLGAQIWIFAQASGTLYAGDSSGDDCEIPFNPISNLTVGWECNPL